MAKNKEAVKISKKHGGKEFSNYFAFVGKVEQHQKWDNSSNSFEKKKIYEEKMTTTNKPRRTILFDLLTTKENRLKVEAWGMENDNVWAYSQSEDYTVVVPWVNRQDKDKLPNDSYHLMEADWDKVERFGQLLKEEYAKGQDIWVKVSGKYEFDESEYEGKTYLIRKRMITDVQVVQDGDKVKIAGQEHTVHTNFDDPNFEEINYFNAQIGIRSTYQNDDDKSTKVNATFLAYGKERSTPKDLELIVKYKEPEEGKVALADAFANLNQYDFVKVYGVDHNRAEITMVPVEVKSDDPFADVGEKTVEMKPTTTGTIKDLEITGIVAGSFMREFLTHEEMSKVSPKSDNYDPFTDDGKPIDISESDLPF